MPALINVEKESQHKHEDLLDPVYTIDVLHNGIVYFRDKEFQLALSYLKTSKIPFDLNKRLDDETSSVLRTAIYFENEGAVKQLLKSGLVDVRTEEYGMNALYYAADTTNLPVLNLIYAHDSNVNNVSHGTPLMSALTKIGSYTLIHDSVWGKFNAENDVERKNMIAWFEGEVTLPGELNIEAEYNAAQKTSLEINWKGGLAMAKYLLERGANPKVANADGIDAEFIANNITNPKSLALFRDCNMTLKFLYEKNGILSFYATLKDRKKLKKLRVQVNFDPREIRELINSYAKKLVDKQAPQKPSFKEWDERFNKLAHEVNAAASHASTATALAIGAHAKADTLTTVVNTNGAVLAHTIGRVDKTEVDIKTLAEDYSPLKEAANIARELAIIKANKVQHSFYETVHKEIDGFITACKQLKGGMLQNADYTIAHKIASGIDAIGGKIPIIGCAAGLLSKAISKGADIYEGRKWERVYHLIPANSAKFCEELSVAITKAYKDELNHVGTVNTAKPEIAIEKVVKLAEKASKVLIESMGGTKVDKTKGVPQGVVTSQVKTLQDNKAFADKVEKYAPASARVEKRELVGKTHSPGKVTGIVVTVATVPSQPLGPTATAKPTPPPVPAKPVVFSATPATAMASSAFMAQMNATVSATAARKLTQAQ